MKKSLAFLLGMLLMMLLGFGQERLVPEIDMISVVRVWNQDTDKDVHCYVLKYGTGIDCDFENQVDHRDWTR